MARAPSAFFFAAILLSSSLVSALVAFSPYLFTSHDPSAISLAASIDSAAMGQNGTIRLTISDRNNLRIPDDLPLSGTWAVQNLSLGACVWHAQYPFGLAVFQGRYTLANVSSAADPLVPAPDFIPGGAYLCPSASVGNSARFEPLQDIALSEEISGYYTSGFTPIPGQPGGTFGVHHVFLPGEYTIAVGDEWGHVQFLYFEVTGPPPSASGLALRIDLGSSTVNAGSPLSADVSLVNPAAEYVSLPVNFSANPDIAKWDYNDTLCGLSSVQHAFGFAVYAGHVTAANASLLPDEVPVSLVPPVATSCPNPYYDESSIQSIELAPNSDSAKFFDNSSSPGTFEPETGLTMQVGVTTGNCSLTSYKFNGSGEENGTTSSSSGTALSYSCGPSDSLDGYWSPPTNGTYVSIDARTNATVTQGLDSLEADYFHELPLGQYTIVAEDLWNDTAFAYFQVDSATPLPVAVSIQREEGSLAGVGYDVTPENIGQTPITSLNATLGSFGLSSPLRSSDFEVSSQYPLLPGQTVYPLHFGLGPFGSPATSLPDLILTVSGTLSTGTPFSYAVEVWAAASGTTSSASTTTGASSEPPSNIVPCGTSGGTSSTTGFVGCSYNATGQVLIEEALAGKYTCDDCGAVNGSLDVYFKILIENIGSSPIYVADGSTGLATSVLQNSTVLAQQTSQPCAETFSVTKLEPQQNDTLTGPSCEAGFVYNLAQSGMVEVTLSFDWSTNPSDSTYPTDFQNTTSVTAFFSLLSTLPHGGLTLPAPTLSPIRAATEDRATTFLDLGGEPA